MEDIIHSLLDQNNISALFVIYEQSFVFEKLYRNLCLVE